MTKPLTIVLDSFAARTGIHYQIEPGASLEIARRVTELGRRPDVIALADPEVFPKLLMPRYTTWYAVFGRNRIVLAYSVEAVHVGPQRICEHEGVALIRRERAGRPRKSPTSVAHMAATRA